MTPDLVQIYAKTLRDAQPWEFPTLPIFHAFTQLDAHYAHTGKMAKRVQLYRRYHKLMTAWEAGSTGMRGNFLRTRQDRGGNWTEIVGDLLRARRRVELGEHVGSQRRAVEILHDYNLRTEEIARELELSPRLAAVLVSQYRRRLREARARS